MDNKVDYGSLKKVDLCARNKKIIFPFDWQ